MKNAMAVEKRATEVEKNVTEVKQEVNAEMKKECVQVKGAKQFLREEEGMGTVEVILIIVVLVGLVLVFKDQITDIVDNLFDKITKQTGKV